MFHAFFFVPVIVFMVIVAPIWLVLHYVSRWRSSRTLSREDERMLVDLWESAKRMEHRIVTLEKILDAEAPQWRRPTP
jgi:phage shock protein B